MTLFIAICDDEIQIGTLLEKDLIEILDSINIKYEIDVYYTGEDLYNKMESGVHYDLIFLDIEFAQNAINGVEVGKLIRDAQKNNLVSIVYISWEKNYAMELFDIRPLHFLVKPLNYEKIEKIIRTYLDISGLLSGVFTYKIGHDTFKARVKDIVYLENRERKIIIVFSDGRSEEFYGSLKEVYEEQLKGFDFIFIHASYVVNYDHITKVEYNQLFINNSALPLPISKHRRNDVRENYYAITKRRRV